MENKKNKLKYYAFTLIELLVVVAIVGVLAVVGIVAYNGYVEATKEKICIYNFKLLSKLIKEKDALCQGQSTIKLKAQYWNYTEGAESNYTCGQTIYTTANAVLKHFTNYAKDPYNNFHYNIGIFTWDGTPYYDGMVSLSGSTIRSRCAGKQLEETIQ